MKTLLIFTFFLILDPVNCFDVIGCSGGTVRIYCKYQQSGQNNKYFCKKGTDECINIQRENTWVHKERHSLTDRFQTLVLVFRNLSLQDSGSYRCGETGGWSHDVELKVKRDPCCSGPSAVTGFLGETLTINCSSPEEFMTDTKGLLKQDGQYFTAVITTTDSQSDRFSFSEDRHSKAVSVTVSDVSEKDGGVYYCGVWITGKSVRYDSLYSEIQLQVTERSPTTLKPTAASSDEEHLNPVSFIFCIIIIIILITVFIFVTLLLILGCKKPQDSASISHRSRPEERTVDYETDPLGNQNIRMCPDDFNPNFITNQSDSLYQNLDPRNREPHSVYQSLNLSKIQSDSVYQSLNSKSTHLFQCSNFHYNFRSIPTL
ncbi:CMRF35-like molecule 8 isoform X2 [Hoplias malabaricus]|uniref:CMRF35-like molecule 8 isoform X2 n=1 Tax=Hoplias malabaricus TaxID=27720 RepID=UPI003463340C